MACAWAAGPGAADACARIGVHTWDAARRPTSPPVWSAAGDLAVVLDISVHVLRADDWAREQARVDVSGGDPVHAAWAPAGALAHADPLLCVCSRDAVRLFDVRGVSARVLCDVTSVVRGELGRLGGAVRALDMLTTPPHMALWSARGEHAEGRGGDGGAVASAVALSATQLAQQAVALAMQTVLPSPTAVVKVEEAPKVEEAAKAEEAAKVEEEAGGDKGEVAAEEAAAPVAAKGKKRKGRATGKGKKPYAETPSGKQIFFTPESLRQIDTFEDLDAVITWRGRGRHKKGEEEAMRVYKEIKARYTEEIKARQARLVVQRQRKARRAGWDTPAPRRKRAKKSAPAPAPVPVPVGGAESSAGATSARPRRASARKAAVRVAEALEGGPSDNENDGAAEHAAAAAESRGARRGPPRKRVRTTAQHTAMALLQPGGVIAQLIETDMAARPLAAVGAHAGLSPVCVTAVAWAPLGADGAACVALGFAGGALLLVRLPKGGLAEATCKSVHAHDGAIEHVAWCGDAQLATSSAAGGVAVWRVSAGGLDELWRMSGRSTRDDAPPPVCTWLAWLCRDMLVAAVGDTLLALRAGAVVGARRVPAAVRTGTVVRDGLAAVLCGARVHRVAWDAAAGALAMQPSDTDPGDGGVTWLGCGAQHACHTTPTHASIFSLPTTTTTTTTHQ